MDISILLTARLCFFPNSKICHLFLKLSVFLINCRNLNPCKYIINSKYLLELPNIVNGPSEYANKDKILPSSAIVAVQISKSAKIELQEQDRFILVASSKSPEKQVN